MLTNHYSTQTEEEKEYFVRLKRSLQMVDALRTPADYSLIDDYCSKMDFFSKHPKNNRYRYYRVSYFVEMQTGDTLFRSGDSADAFYAIISGKINIVVDIASTATQTRDLSRILKGQGSPEKKSGDVSTRYSVKQLGALTSFGELTMLNKDTGVRTASVVAIEPTALIRINREDFVDLDTLHKGYMTATQADFLSTISLFYHWNRQMLINLAHHIQQLSLTYNTPLVVEGMPINFFYIIKLGELRMVKGFEGKKVVEVEMVEKGAYVGSYEILRFEKLAQFTIIVASSRCEVFRISKSDFNSLIASDPKCLEIIEARDRIVERRVDPERVFEDLKKNKAWDTYKKHLLDEIVPSKPLNNPSHSPANSESHAAASSRSPRKPEKEHSKAKPSVNSSRRKVHTKPEWLEWATAKVENLDESSTNRENGTTLTEGQIHETNIRWNRTTKILCKSLYDECQRLHSEAATVEKPSSPKKERRFTNDFNDEQYRDAFQSWT